MAPGRWQRLLAALSDLRLAIGLLLLIAVASALGTALPQGEPSSTYHDNYDNHPWLGLIPAAPILLLQLDHVYSSVWFLGLLGLLGVSLLLCSIRRQLPSLRAALKWTDYQHLQQLTVFSIGCTVDAGPDGVNNLADRLRQRGWQVRQRPRRLAARKGIWGRVGPLLVHAGLIVLMVGAAWGALAGNRLERFLAPGRTLDLMDRHSRLQLSVRLDAFAVERDTAGRAEQFRSRVSLSSPTMSQPREEEISVNHPLRIRGITLYQADWQVAAVTLRLGRSPRLQVPTQPLPSLGEQVWGVVLPTRPDGSQPVLLTIDNEQGPVRLYDSAGKPLGSVRVGGPALEVEGLPIRVDAVLPASGLLLKRDPGVPLVYGGFAVVLLGGTLSVISTRQLWAVQCEGKLHVAGLSNRDVVGFGETLPRLLEPLTDADRGQP